MNQRHFAPLATTIVALLAPVLCLGQASVVDEFTGSPGNIAGTGGGTGFGGTYTGAGSVVSPGLTYPNLLTAGNSFQTAGTNNGAFRTLAAPINTDAGTVYIGFLTAAAQGTAPDYAGLSLFSNGTNTEEIFLGKPFQAGNYGFDISGVAGGALNSATAPVGTTPSLLVYRLTFTPTGDKIDFFANPTPGQALPATPTLTFNIPEGELADTLTSIRLQSGEGAGTATPFRFDELRGGGSFADVAPVPEPAALGLLGVAGLLALRRRR
jgi:MYXO-CTERM domain-containing protein